MTLPHESARERTTEIIRRGWIMVGYAKAVEERLARVVAESAARAAYHKAVLRRAGLLKEWRQW